MGDTTDTGADTDTDATDATPPADDTDGDLGEAGKKALATEREARKTAERQAKELAAQLEELRRESLTDAEKAVAEAREAGRSEALTAANARIVRAEVLAAATGTLKDPADAVGFLPLDQFTVADDGEVDTEAIKAAIAELVKAKPYLGAGPASPSPLPGGSATESSTGSNPNDWLRGALKAA